MTDRIDDNPPMSIQEQAAEWLLRWHCGDLSIAERFEYLQWLKTSPVHIAETLRMCRLYSWLAGTKLKLFVTNEDSFSNVVELPPREREAVAARIANRAGMWRVSLIAGAAAIGVSIAVGFFAKALYLDHKLQTQASEWRSLPLDDGSSITAGPYTKLHHDIGDEQRLIDLAEGKAVFRVAKDPQRPFLVDAGPAIVTAVGTKFTVERHGREVTVTMHEGRVVVTPAPGSGATFQTASLAADDRWTLSGSEAPQVAQVDGELELEWSRGRLIFKTGVTVGAAAAQFNSYNKTRIVVDDRVSEKQIRGSFEAIDPLSFAAMVQQSAGVSVVRESAELIRIEQSAPHR